MLEINHISHLFSYVLIHVTKTKIYICSMYPLLARKYLYSLTIAALVK